MTNYIYDFDNGNSIKYNFDFIICVALFLLIKSNIYSFGHLKICNIIKN